MNNATTTPSEMLQNAPATVTIEPAAYPTAYTRVRYYAHGAQGGAVSLTVSRDERDPSIHRVTWNVNRGRGWAKGWKATKGSEVEAMAFAADKWAYLVAWLEKLVVVDDDADGAVAAFSAQVASMAR